MRCGRYFWRFMRERESLIFHYSTAPNTICIFQNHIVMGYHILLIIFQNSSTLRLNLTQKKNRTGVTMRSLAFELLGIALCCERKRIIWILLRMFVAGSEQSRRQIFNISRKSVGFLNFISNFKGWYMCIIYNRQQCDIHFGDYIKSYTKVSTQVYGTNNVEKVLNIFRLYKRYLQRKPKIRYPEMS